MRGIQKRFFVRFGLAITLGLYGALGLAADQTAFGPSTAFKIASMQGMTNSVLACGLNPALNQIQAGMKNGVGACTGGIPADDFEMTCEAFYGGDGRFDVTFFEKQKKAIDGGLGYIACQNNKLAAAQSAVGCLTSQSAALEGMVSSFQAGFQEYMGSVKEQVAQSKSREDDTKAKLEDLDDLLNGDGNSKRKGLVESLRETEMAMNVLNGDLVRVRERQKDAQNRYEVYTQFLGDTTMTETFSCFSTAKKYKCSPNGPMVSARDHALCRFEQNQRVSPGGTVERSSLASKQAAARAMDLANVLNRFLKGAQTGALKVTSVGDVQSIYGNELARFNGNGLNISKFVLDELNSCNKIAQKAVATQEKNPGSPLGKEREDIAKMRREISDDVAKNVLPRVAKEYKDAWFALTGTNQDMNFSSCENAVPAAQLQCLEQAKAELQGLVAGTSAKALRTFVVNGTKPETTMTLQCRGLRGCEQALQVKFKEGKTVLKREIEERKKFVVAMNKAMQTEASNKAAAFKGANLQIQEQVESVNRMLGELGIGDKVNCGVHEMEGYGQPDEDGLMSPPSNVLNLISKEVGGLANCKGSEFAESTRGISDKRGELDKTAARLAKDKAKAQSMVATCKHKEREPVFTALSSLETNLTECSDYAKEACNGASNPAATLQSLGATFDVQFGNLDTLLAGCVESREQPKANPYASLKKTSYGGCDTLAKQVEKAKEDKEDIDDAKYIVALTKFKQTCSDLQTLPELKKNSDITEGNVENVLEEFKLYRESKKTITTCKSVFDKTDKHLKALQGIEQRYGSAGAATDD